MIIIASIEIISSSLLYFTVKFDLLYIFIILTIAACLGGNFVCIIPLYTQIYGMDAGPRMYALTGAIIAMGQFCGPLLVKFFLSEKKDYLVTFLFGGTLCVIKLIFLIFFDDKEKINISDDNFKEDNWSKFWLIILKSIKLSSTKNELIILLL